MPKVGLKEFLNLARVVASGKMMHEADDTRSFTSRFQTGLAKKMGVQHSLVVNSGTSALITALVASGVKPGDEVLIPAYTWVSTAIAPLMMGAIPILVDVDDTLTIDIEDLIAKLSPFTKAIIPVHMLNLVCNMDEIKRIASEHNLIVIEDACQAVGVTYKGRRVGSIGHAGAFSFNHYKNISAGEGGAILTNSNSLYEKASVYHDIGTFSGRFDSEEQSFVGANMRISELTGAVLLAQLDRIDGILEAKRRRRRRFLNKHPELRPSPHHDSPSAVGLTLIFDTSEEALAFCETNRFAIRIADIRRHDYVSWLPVLQNCRADPQTDPFRFAQRIIQYDSSMCSRTMDILRRSCLIV